MTTSATDRALQTPMDPRHLSATRMLLADTLGIKPEVATEVLEDIVGDAPTYGDILQVSLEALQITLRNGGIKVPLIKPQNAIAAYQVAVAFGPRAPLCNTCKRYPVQKVGVDWQLFTEPGTACPWPTCSFGMVEAMNIKTDHVSWVSNRKVPLDQEYDNTALAGAKIPLTTEGILRHIGGERVIDTTVQLAMHEVAIDVPTFLRYFRHGPETRVMFPNVNMTFSALTNPQQFGLYRYCQLLCVWIG